MYFKIKYNEPEVVTQFRAELKVYIDSIKEGNLEISIISNLMNSLEELKRHKDFEKISIKLSAEDLDLFVNQIYKYTEKLANDNEIYLTDEERENIVTSNGGILNLERYLMHKSVSLKRLHDIFICNWIIVRYTIDCKCICNWK